MHAHQKEWPGGGSTAPSGQEANSRREGVVCSDDALVDRLTGCPARTVLHMPKMPAMVPAEAPLLWLRRGRQPRREASVVHALTWTHAGAIQSFERCVGTPMCTASGP